MNLAGLFAEPSLSDLVRAQAESPIEERLARGLFRLLPCQAVAGSYHPDRDLELALRTDSQEPIAFLFAQQRIGRYRADLLLVLIDPQVNRTQRIVIECDGIDFHTSDAQKWHDWYRDQQITEAGYSVYRFTGRQINYRIWEVIDCIARLMREFGMYWHSDDGDVYGEPVKFTPKPEFTEFTTTEEFL